MPDRNIPQAIYWAIGIAIVIYVVLAFGALSAIPQALLIRDKEFALAAGATKTRGSIAVAAMGFLGIAAISILYYELKTNIHQMFYIFSVYVLLIVSAKIHSVHATAQTHEKE